MKIIGFLLLFCSQFCFSQDPNIGDSKKSVINWINNNPKATEVSYKTLSTGALMVIFNYPDYVYRAFVFDNDLCITVSTALKYGELNSIMQSLIDNKDLVKESDYDWKYYSRVNMCIKVEKLDNYFTVTYTICK